MQLDQIIGNGLLKYLYVITVQQDLAALPLICPAAKDEATNGLLLDAIFLADQTPIFFQAPLDQFVEEQNLLCQQRIKNLNPAAWDQAISLDITSVLFSRNNLPLCKKILSLQKHYQKTYNMITNLSMS